MNEPVNEYVAPHTPTIINDPATLAAIEQRDADRAAAALPTLRRYVGEHVRGRLLPASAREWLATVGPTLRGEAPSDVTALVNSGADASLSIACDLLVSRDAYLRKNVRAAVERVRTATAKCMRASYDDAALLVHCGSASAAEAIDASTAAANAEPAREPAFVPSRGYRS